jgi:uncharacterized protein (DUF433 family)
MTTSRKIDIYGGRNPLDVPAYTPGLAAYYLSLPSTTVRYWAFGRQPDFAPVIKAEAPEQKLLSFRNLVEMHVLSAVRRKHGVAMPRVRAAIDFLKREKATAHPLSDIDLETDGNGIYIRMLGQLLDASREGQRPMETLIREHLQRIDRSADGVPIRLFPFRQVQRQHEQLVVQEGPKFVVIDPRVQFGRPCIEGTGTPTAIVFDRYRSGESVKALARDYDRPTAMIEEAIFYEKARQRAA